MSIIHEYISKYSFVHLKDAVPAVSNGCPAEFAKEGATGRLVPRLFTIDLSSAESAFALDA